MLSFMFVGNVKIKLFRLIKDKKSLFLIVGAYNTAIGFLLANSLMLALDDRYVFFVLLATYPIILVHNFFSFEKIVFKSNVNFFTGLLRLNNSYIITIIAQIFLVSSLVYLFGVNDSIAYNIVFPFLVIGQYFIHTKYTFK